MEIRLLGPIEASLDRGPARLGPRQQQAVLAMLALAVNRTVSTDRLIEGLWGERAPASAPKLVQLYVSHLRKLLRGEAEIVTRGRGYELRLAADRVDVARFEDLVAAASNADGSAAAPARQALALWRGAALANVADEPFADAEIRRLEELRLRATELAIDGDLAGGRHRELIGELDVLVAQHPLSERLQAQRMLALYRSGRQSEALAAYRQARRVLVSEIGVEPGPELRRLHDAILRQDATALDLPAAAAPPPVTQARRAPRPASRTVGRRALVAFAALTLISGLAISAASRWTRPDRLAGIEENSVGVIDPQSARITAQYVVGRAPRALASGGGSMWSLSASDQTVSRIDGRRIVPIAVGDDPAGLTFAAGSLWVTDGHDGVVSQVSPARNRVVRTLGVGNAPGAIAAGFGALWIASQVDPTVVRVDLASGATSTIDLGSTPTAIAAGAAAVWVASEEGGIVYRIEPRTRTVVDSIHVGNGPVGVAVGEGAVWVANRQDATVSRVDPATDTITGVTRVGRAPSAIAAGSGAVWVADSGDAAVTRIDPTLRRPPTAISIKSSPAAIAVADGSVWTAVRAPPVSHRGGTLRVDIGSLFAGDPQDDPTGPMSLVYDGLVTYRRVGGSTFGALVGDLATDVPEPSPDGRTYVFRLRPNIRYSNGAPVRPRDFRASLEAVFQRTASNPLPGPYRDIEGVPACVRRPSRCDLSRGVVTDARAGTITLHLTRPDPDLIYYLTSPFGYMVPADHPFGGGTLPPGTGPYRIASFNPGLGVRLVRNPYFHVWSSDARPAGFADMIEVSLGQDIVRQIADVQHGRADLVVVGTTFGGPLPPARLRALEISDAEHVHTDAAPELDFMFFNVDTPPFDDVRVRRAINYAVDRRTIGQLAGGPAVARWTCQLVPPGFPDSTPSCPYTLNPGPAGAWTAPDTARARRLIQQSGTRGMRVTVWGYEDKRAIIRYFAALLRRLGYRSSTRLFPDYGSYKENITAPHARAQIGIEGWSADIGAPSNFTLPFLCSTSDAGFCDRRGEAKIAVARAARGRRAITLWKRVYRRFAAAAPTVPLVNRRTVTLVSDRVGNYQNHPMWTTLLDQLWVR
jgi:peptide/nickel transport system substrate-binding protein